MKQTTPKKVNGVIRAFCRELSTNKPRFVPVQHLANAKPGHCITNVWTTARSSGGKAIYGWCIWYDPKSIIDAEYHAIWETSEGRWVDITPKQDGETSILFVPLGDTPNEQARAYLAELEKRHIAPGLPPIDPSRFRTPNRVKFLPRIIRGRR